MITSCFVSGFCRRPNWVEASVGDPPFFNNPSKIGVLGRQSHVVPLARSAECVKAQSRRGQNPKENTVCRLFLCRYGQVAVAQKIFCAHTVGFWVCKYNAQVMCGETLETKLESCVFNSLALDPTHIFAHNSCKEINFKTPSKFSTSFENTYPT